MVLLQCRHRVEYTPPPTIEDDVLYCRRCRDYVQIDITVPSVEWMIRCAHCTLARKFGADKEHAERVAAKHVTKRASHRVRISNGDSEQDIYVGGTEPYIPAIQDWLAQNPTHQTSLRSLPKRDL